MSFVKKGASAFGKLFTVIALAGTFIVGLIGVVYISLQGQELKVPEIVGKDFVESERELASLGLRLKRRADRPSTEKPNTVLEQLPKAGETLKTGQTIFVVTSKTSLEGETPLPIKKTTDEDDSEKIEELISDKPKKSNKANTNVNKKKSSTTRDVIGNNSNENSNSSNDNSNSNKSNSNSGTNKNTATNANKSNSNANKANSNNPATGGDVRPRRTPQP